MAEDATAEIRVVGDFSEFDREVERRQNIDRTSTMSFGGEGVRGALPAPTAPRGYLPPPLPLPVLTDQRTGTSSGGESGLVRVSAAMDQAAVRIESAVRSLAAVAGGGAGRRVYQGEEVGPIPRPALPPGWDFEGSYTSYSHVNMGRGGGFGGGGGGGGWGGGGGGAGAPGGALPPPGPPGTPWYQGYTPGYGYPPAPGGGQSWYSSMQWRQYYQGLGGLPYGSARPPSFWQRVNGALAQVPRRWIITGLFALAELGRAQRATEEADYSVERADTQQEQIAARVQGIETATSGLFGSTLRYFWDQIPGSGSPRERIRALQDQATRLARLDRIGVLTVQARNTGRLAAAAEQGPEATELANLVAQRDVQRQANTSRISEIGRMLAETREPTDANEAILMASGKVSPFVIADPTQRSLLGMEQRGLRQQESALDRLFQAQQSSALRQQAGITAQYQARFAAANFEFRGLETQAQERMNQDYRHKAELAAVAPERQEALKAAQFQENLALMRRQEIERNDANREINIQTSLARMQATGFDQFQVEQRSLALHQESEIEQAKERGNRYLIPGLQILHTYQRQVQTREHALRIEGLGRTTDFRQRIAQMIDENAGQAEMDEALLDEQQAQETQSWKQAGLVGGFISRLLAPAQAAERQGLRATRARQRRFERAREARQVGTLIRSLGRQSNVERLLAQDRPEEARIEEIENQRQEAQERAASISNFEQRTAAQKAIDQLAAQSFQRERRDYLRSFRAEQIDLTKIDVTNARDQDDPTEVLKSIDSKIGNLSLKLETIAE